MKKTKIIKLKDVATITMGQSPPSNSYNKSKDGYPFYQGKTDFGVLYPTARVYCNKPKKTANKNELLLSVRAPIGDVNISIEECCIGRGVAAIRPDGTNIDLKYLYYNMSYNKKRIADLGSGSTFKAINKKQIEDIPILHLSIDKQQKVVCILDQISELISKRQQQITSLSNLKQSIFYDMFGDPQLNTKKWKKGRIRDLTAFTQYGSSKKASETEGKYPILRMNNITYEGELVLDNLKFIDLDEKEKTKYLVSKGDLLFNRTNSKELVGKTAVYDKNDPVAYAGYLVKLVPNNLANAHFISGYLNSNYGKRYLFNMAKNIVGMANINAKELQSIPIIIPPKKLQDEYENKLKEIIIRIEVMKNSLKHYENLYNSLMQKAFKGELFQDEDTNCR